MISVLFFVSIFINLSESNVCTGHPLDRYNDEKCYFIRNEAEPYEYQENWCSKWHPNGHLASIHSVDEYIFLKKSLEEDKRYYVGLKMKDNRDFRYNWNYMSWSDGSDTDYKPNINCDFTDKTKCFILTNDNWEDWRCSENAFAICKFTPYCEGDCSNRGSCTSDNICSCETGYLPPDCSRTSEDLPSCDGISAANTSVCSGHGECRDEDECVCFEGYVGTFCDTFDQAWYSFFADQAVILPVAISVSIFVILVYGCCVALDFFIMVRNCKKVERGGHFFSFRWNKRHTGWESSEEGDFSSDDDSYMGSTTSSGMSDFGRRRARVDSDGSMTDDEMSRMAGSLRKKQIQTEEDDRDISNEMDNLIDKERIKFESEIEI